MVERKKVLLAYLSQIQPSYNSLNKFNTYHRYMLPTEGAWNRYDGEFVPRPEKETLNTCFLFTLNLAFRDLYG